MNNKIPSAEEFMALYHDSKNKHALINYAKLHCEAQLKAILENVKIKTETYFSPDESNWKKIVDEDSIIKAYDLNQIK
jgi:hypothetical protein